MARKWLLSQNNSNLRRDGIFTWTLPAWVVELPTGGHMNVCPSAGICAKLCYARVGSYRYRNVREAHMRNLLLTLEDPSEFEAKMSEELQHKRYANRHIRLHDAGDFYSREYLGTWLSIMRQAPESVTFYAYTKEVSMFQEIVEPDPPKNFKWCYSYGGREDHLIDPASMRHADVFPDEDAVAEAGYSSQTESDLLAVYGDPLVGIPANRIPHLLKRQGDNRFSELQTEQDRRLAEAKARRAKKAKGTAAATDYGLIS